MQRNGVGTIIFGKHTFLNGRTRFFEREKKKDIFLEINKAILFLHEPVYLRYA